MKKVFLAPVCCAVVHMPLCANGIEPSDVENFHPSAEALLIMRSDGTRFVKDSDGLALLLGEPSWNSRFEVEKLIAKLDSNYSQKISEMSEREYEIFSSKSGNIDSIREKILAEKARVADIPLCDTIGLPEYQSGKFFYPSNNLPGYVGENIEVREYRDRFCKTETLKRPSDRCQTVMKNGKIRKVCAEETYTETMCSGVAFDAASDDLKMLLEKDSLVAAVLCATGPYTKNTVRVESAHGWIEFVDRSGVEKNLNRLASRYAMQYFDRKWKSEEPKYSRDSLVGTWRLFDGSNDTNLVLNFESKDAAIFVGISFEKPTQVTSKSKKKAAKKAPSAPHDVTNDWSRSCADVPEGACQDTWDLNALTGEFWLRVTGDMDGKDIYADFEGRIDGDQLRLMRDDSFTGYFLRKVPKGQTPKR